MTDLMPHVDNLRIADAGGAVRCKRHRSARRLGREPVRFLVAVRRNLKEPVRREGGKASAAGFYSATAGGYGSVVRQGVRETLEGLALHASSVPCLHASMPPCLRGAAYLHASDDTSSPMLEFGEAHSPSSCNHAAPRVLLTRSKLESWW